MSVFIHPVVTDPPGNPAQDMAGQMRDPYPGQDQETHIVGDKMEVAPAGGDVPSDKGVPGLGFPGGRAEEEAGQGIAIPIKDEIAHILADGSAIIQIVVKREITIGKLPVFWGLDYFNPNGS